MAPTELMYASREETYDMPYAKINWVSQRGNVGDADRLGSSTLIQRTFSSALNVHEQYKIPFDDAAH